MERFSLYIVLTRTSTIVSRLIGFSTGDYYTHAAISLDKELKNMYSFARKYSYNPFIGRFKKENINLGAYRFGESLPGIIIELKTTKEQYEKVLSLLEEFILQPDRYKYNYKGLFYGLTNRAVNSSDRFLCSEFVYYILYNSGIVDFGIAPNLVRPQYFLNLEGEVVFQGDLRKAEFLACRYDDISVEERKLFRYY
jgi:hypothetical protein